MGGLHTVLGLGEDAMGQDDGFGSASLGHAFGNQGGSHGNSFALSNSSGANSSPGRTATAALRGRVSGADESIAIVLEGYMEVSSAVETAAALHSSNYPGPVSSGGWQRRYFTIAGG